MTAYVHIGTGKTGTTSIQAFLRKNEEGLHKQGIQSFVYCITFETHRYDLTSLGGYGNLTADKRIQMINALKNKFQNYPYTKVIFSHEALQGLFTSKKHIITFKQSLQDLGFNDFKIIVYLREPLDLAISIYGEIAKALFGRYANFNDENKCLEFGEHLCNHKQTLQWWSEVFGKENVIPRLFNKEDFIEGDLLKDFIFALGLEWDSEFKIPGKLNETIDLLGIEVARGMGKLLCNRHGRGQYYCTLRERFTLTDKSLKYLPPKNVALKYLEYFAPSNEWVREHYFPHKKTLFPPKDMTNYKENNHLTTMKEEYWERIGGFIVDIVDSKNEMIKERDNQIKQQQFTLNYGTAQTRIQKQLTYQLGKALIENSKSLLGFIRIPYVLSYIKEQFQKELKTYQEKIKNNPNLKLPPLESYPDYKEALKLKNHLSYKLGEAILKAKSIGLLRGGESICY